MFRCQISNRLSQPGEAAFKVVTERRPKNYYGPRGDKVGEGWEIVKEVLVCKEVYERLLKEQDAAR